MIRPATVRLEAASVCQLRCPSCPTTYGEIRHNIGAGVLSLERFQQFVDQNPWVSDIELSNWGEIFLNRGLIDIVQYAFTKGVALRADNGVNLNTATDDVLRALVAYKFRSMTCSIDGATADTYAIYRKRGDLNRVLEHVRTINAYKRQYRSVYPRLQWKFVAFTYNEHEIAAARRLANELDMSFRVEPSWDQDRPSGPSEGAIRGDVSCPVASEPPDDQSNTDPYRFCAQLWDQPQVHHDGEVLGCCVNRWGSFGNAFIHGLPAILDGERMQHARLMLEGKADEREDVPCSQCSYYRDMVRDDRWVDRSGIQPPTWRRRVRQSRLANRIINRFVNRPLYEALGKIAARRRRARVRLGALRKPSRDHPDYRPAPRA